ncbi:hypothetical protein RFI_26607 [Reticulomyxa filosa]|uniref:Uncharacterized protein n=1 Tax=Reticulomyxa filosa TaxID=46433 RepID=X6MA44_RETFI|nr:hypothetical protein RFI_26607 [Reticulomyxa filosa]|eukprot:ETO10769.1 hypothetical protein RFI_26607 [Reticulomyxa filosa]
MYLYFNVKVLVKNLHEINVKFNQRQQLSVENKKKFGINQKINDMFNVKDVKNPDLNRYSDKYKFVLNFASCKAFNNNRNNPKSHFCQYKKCFGLNYYINEVQILYKIKSLITKLKNKLFVQTINLFQHKDLFYLTKINSSFENESWNKSKYQLMKDDNDKLDLDSDSLPITFSIQLEGNMEGNKPL